jgi:hypothetical protein
MKRHFKRKERYDSALERCLSRLRDAGIAYTLLSTTYTSTIDSVAGVMKFSWGEMDVKDLRFIREVKRHFAKLEVPDALRPPGDRALYNGSSRFMRAGRYHSFVEIDVSQAYWTQAKKLGYLPGSGKLEEMKKQASKPARLIALGALASRFLTGAMSLPKNPCAPRRPFSGTT